MFVKRCLLREFGRRERLHQKETENHPLSPKFKVADWANGWYNDTKYRWEGTRIDHNHLSEPLL